MMDMLSRLPLKSLFNCKFVCETWLLLISDPHFAKLHLAKSSTTFLIQANRWFIIRKSLLALIVEEVSSNTWDVEKIRFLPNTNLTNTDFRLINSCNGLICLWGRSKAKSHEMVHVCNPILGECITIPLVKKPRKWEQNLALGFIYVSNQYKVLQTFYLDGASTTQCQAEVYTVGSGQWRSIGNAPFSLDHLDANAFLHDSVHWIDYSPENDGFICAFDFGFEQFTRLLLSSDSQMHDGWGRHSFSCDVEKLRYGLWRSMESWSKKFVVGHVVNDCLSYESLFFLSSGEILMLKHDQCIIHYDPKCKSFEDTEITHRMEIISVTAYGPSFRSGILHKGKN
ncbi:unnamed protein product [Dovyalis caffra]|uniref:F-box protein n=1 Tax=Dovyalis caffra TaxID=77055 RepID=A0AAV1RP19_9ROSI|nr:unnamed protein product [Dovyalis caffra]